MNASILIFAIFSMLGWVWESIYFVIVDGKWQSRGFLYGPFCPIYGVGGIIGLIVYNLMQQGKIPSLPAWGIFVAGFAISMILEYPISVILEKLFSARWWDYSEFPLNINGRTSVPTSMGFGAAAIFIMRILLPALIGWVAYIPEPAINIIALVVVALLSADLTITISMLTDFQKKIVSLDENWQNHMTEIVDHLYENGNHLYNQALKRITVIKLPRPRLRHKEAVKQNEERFNELVKDYKESPVVNKMNEYIQHGCTTTLEHCENVAWVSFLINKKLHLNVEEKNLVEAAMLHDLYLYDWHDGEKERRIHGFTHPKKACENAIKYFDIPEDEQRAIKSHMWPLTITQIPTNKAAAIICVADKYCAIIETIRRKKTGVAD